MGGYAWVTLATNDAYSLGALVLAHSLRRVGTKYELAVLITPGVTQTMREKLSAVFSVVTEVNVLDSKDEANLALLARPELGVTFTKLHCWRLTQYEKCVFLDADTLVVRNCDELFEREELSAAPDVGWPDCFNSGVFVYRPSQQTFASITTFAAAKGSFDGGDQGLLNMYFSDWARKDISKHLPFIYNMCSTATYSYLPAFKQFGDDVRIIHFIGITKPWLQYFDTLTGIVQPPMGSTHLQPLLQLWWNIFCDKVHPQLSPVMATSTLAPIWHEFTPVPYESPIPRSSVYTDVQQDQTQKDIYLEPPDFSEFQDPWENYCAQNDPVIHNTDINETQQYYSTVHASLPIPVLNQRYESPPEYNRQYNSEYNNSSHRQCIYSQKQSQPFQPQPQSQPFQPQSQPFQPQSQSQSQSESESETQSSQFANNKPEQQHSYFHSNDTHVQTIQHNHWQNHWQNSVPVYSVEKHHSDESQHQRVDYQPAYQHPPNNSGKSLPEETRQHQRNESYVNHDHSSHHQTYDHVNNKQFVEHHEQEKQTHESSDVEMNHRQATQNNVAYQHDLSFVDVKKCSECEQNEHIRDTTDERTNTLISISTSPHPDSTPCTEIHNVATQSDPHITDDLNSTNGGLAGALAQMTLGEPRSAEQIALEEHMRKQSWEQGHIDYMGRDSFDNIWKKICETLALAPPRLPSPPKETEKPEKATTNKTDESVKSSETMESIESVDEVDKGTAQATSSRTEEQSLVNNVPITSVPKLSEKNEQVIAAGACSVKESEDDISQRPISAESKSETPDAFVDSSPVDLSQQQASPQEISNKEQLGSPSSSTKESLQQTTVTPVSPDSVQPSLIEEQKAIASAKEPESDTKNVAEELGISVDDVKQQAKTAISDEKHAKQLSTASEILTVSPVPIQVAESVLQVEPKESALDSQAMPQQVLSSTITPVHLTEVEEKLRINGSTPSEEKLSSASTAAAVESVIDNTARKLSEPSEAKGTSQILLPVEQVETASAVSLESSETPEESSEKQVTESLEEIESSRKESVESIESTPSDCEKSKTSSSSSSGKTPVRPTRAKELSTPSTPAPKPVQQPPKGQEKAIKKTVKKSTEKSAAEGGEAPEVADGDGNEKKVAKKVVKKVAKKTKSKSEEGLDDGSEDSSSAVKQKKTVKVVKKGTKSSQAAAPDAAVPETPSSSTSDAPVPPKRKTKATPTKSAAKKSDTEQ